MKKRVISLISYILVATLSAALTLTMVYWNDDSFKLAQLENLILECHIDPVDEVLLEDAAAQAMLESTGDRWSYYIPAAEYQSHLESVENAYVGIGITIVVAHDGDGLQIVAVAENSPAAEAGLMVDDVIIEVEGQSMSGKDTNDARDLVRGEEGTRVELTVRRAGEKLAFSVLRKRVEVVVASGEMVTDTIGLITIDNFDDRCASETIAAIESLQQQGAKKLIFDVRNNPGGYAHELVEVLDYLLPEGDLFRTVDYLGNEEVDVSDADYLDLPMAVLVNGESYSAAEFFAVALQEYDAAIVVGEKTTGKGYFQQTFKLNDGSAAAISTGKYFTPRGISLEGVGILPDVEVIVDERIALDIYYDRLEPQEDPQLQAAIRALN